MFNPSNFQIIRASSILCSNFNEESLIIKIQILKIPMLFFVVVYHPDPDNDDYDFISILKH